MMNILAYAFLNMEVAPLLYTLSSGKQGHVHSAYS